jgi:hypothetical protein
MVVAGGLARAYGPVGRGERKACGNLTRFDVVSTRRTRAYHHYSVGGELVVEEEQVLAETIEDVSCRWCGGGHAVVALEDGLDLIDADTPPADPRAEDDPDLVGEPAAAPDSTNHAEPMTVVEPPPGA